MTPLTGFSTDALIKTTVNFFDYKVYNDYFDGIDNGSMVILMRKFSDGTGHVMVGVGYNPSTKDVIYFDPLYGGALFIAPISSFLNTMTFITNNK